VQQPNDPPATTQKDPPTPVISDAKILTTHISLGGEEIKDEVLDPHTITISKEMNEFASNSSLVISSTHFKRPNT
jgi:hypothetical protein